MKEQPITDKFLIQVSDALEKLYKQSEIKSFTTIIENVYHNIYVYRYNNFTNG